MNTTLLPIPPNKYYFSIKTVATISFALEYKIEKNPAFFYLALSQYQMAILYHKI